MAISKEYTVTVSSAHDFSETPSVATFSMNATEALEILNLAKLVESNNLYSVSRFDYRADFLKTDPNDLPTYSEEGQDDDNHFASECDTLNVSSNSFWFTGCAKHTDIEFSTAHQPISDLAQHFGLVL